MVEYNDQIIAKTLVRQYMEKKLGFKTIKGEKITLEWKGEKLRNVKRKILKLEDIRCFLIINLMTWVLSLRFF